MDQRFFQGGPSDGPHRAPEPSPTPPVAPGPAPQPMPPGSPGPSQPSGAYLRRGTSAMAPTPGQMDRMVTEERKSSVTGGSRIGPAGVPPPGVTPRGSLASPRDRPGAGPGRPTKGPKDTFLYNTLVAGALVPSILVVVG